MFEGLRWRDAVRQSQGLAAEEQTKVCAACQYKYSATQGLQSRLDSQLFSCRQEFITEMERNGIRGQEEVKNIKCLHLSELIA